MNNLIEKIKQLKKQCNAVLLVHNYQRDKVQDIADYLGDSLGLSQQAAKTSADVIVFCGVHFMAETAKIISPKKTVLMPDPHAGCPMAEMIDVKKLKELKSQNPKAAVVCYVNSSAAVKAESDICCTSANAAQICRSVQKDEIIFIPDKYLGRYVSTQVKNKKFILSSGFCPTHAKIMPEHISQAKKSHPQAKVIVHPECRPETIILADAVLSTRGMIKYAQESSAGEFIIGTEIGILYRLRRDNPAKYFYPALEQAVCPNMKLTTLEKVLWSLEDMETKITVPAEIADKARTAIEKMLSM
ncbi:quinolinate synthase NadA [Candidatus Saganbacteria bacterium]|nr:quinolinate synthase NadA [Candidatus Saganbacteria bacterium]